MYNPAISALADFAIKSTLISFFNIFSFPNDINVAFKFPFCEFQTNN